MNTIENNTDVMVYGNTVANAFSSRRRNPGLRAFNGSLNPITSTTTDGILMDLDMHWEMSKQPIRVLHPDGVSDPFTDPRNMGVVARNLLTGEYQYSQKVVGDGFTFTQNDPIIDALRRLQEAGVIQLNLGGVFDNHTKCFVHATIGDEYEIGHDPHQRGILFKWAHDGSAALQAKPGTTRLFCLNQVPTFGSSWFTVKHTKSAEIKMKELEGMVVKAVASLDEYDRLMERLLDIKIMDQAFDAYVRDLVPLNPKVENTPEYLLTTGEKRSRTMVQNKRAAVRDVYYASPTQADLYGTAAGAFHAAVEAFDHRFTGNRGQRVLAGQDVEFKDRARSLALAL